MLVVFLLIAALGLAGLVLLLRRPKSTGNPPVVARQASQPASVPVPEKPVAVLAELDALTWLRAVS